MSAPVAPTPGWTVVLPVKGGPDAKSRLDHPARGDLARAVALDAVEAVLACTAVARALVVTADPRVAVEHLRLGAGVVADPGGGLARAVAAGVARAVRLAAATPCAVLLADLPSLRPDDLGETLDRCARLLAVGAAQVTVPDADGTGTVLLAAATPGGLRPRFGPASAVAHAAEAVVLPEASPGLRRDVDTVAHLEVAAGHGVGPRTASVLAAQPRSTMAPSAASFSPNRS